MIPFIGLTGGIGAGKSTALAAFERLGSSCLSTDRVVHELYASPDVRDAVVNRFGPGVLTGAGIDRAALAQLAFATAGDRAWLEQLLWPRVDARMAAWREGLEHASPLPRAAVVEVPLLFEAGLERGFDATVAVIAEETLRDERASSRGHQALAQRAARQLSQREKSERATYSVVNDGSVPELESKLSAILDMLQR